MNLKEVNIANRKVLNGFGNEDLLKLDYPEHSCLLISGGDSPLAENSFFAWDPLIILKAKGKEITFLSDKKEKTFTGNPFNFAEELLDKCCGEDVKAFGYLSYDLNRHLEELPRTTVDDIGIPDMYLMIPRYVISHHTGSSSSDLTEYKFTGENNSTEDPLDKLMGRPEQSPQSSLDWNPHITKDEYLNSVETIREYIRTGHVYQVNFAQRFSADFSVDPADLFTDIFKSNPAPFCAYLDIGERTNILSTSPERFVMRSGRHIESVPIKGTRPRGKDTDNDLKEKLLLESNIKEDSELSMIVDLLRNDIGKVAIPGSVKVRDHKRIEAYSNVFQMMSTIEAELDENISNIEILKALFPCGSITGCPKIRAMEIIDELEPVTRGMYTGSIGWLDSSSSMDLNVAIRTAVFRNEKLYLSVGGGIVYDSDPDSEYEETLYKGESFLRF